MERHHHGHHEGHDHDHSQAHDHDHGHGHQHPEPDHKHGHSHGHAHSHVPSSAGVMYAALGLTLGYAAVEATAGMMSGSLALVSDAGHMVTDAVALGIAAF